MPLGRICRRSGNKICTTCGRTCRLDNARRASKSRAHGLTTRAWQRLRAAALERDDYLCTLRRPGCTGKATTVHLRADLGGAHQPATIGDCASCCAHCHGSVDGPRARR